MPRYLLYFSAVSLPIWTTMTALGIWLPYANPDGSFGNPTIPALLLGAVFGLFAAGSATLLLSSTRTRLMMSNGELSICNLFSTDVIRASDITRCRWRCNAGRAIAQIEIADKKRTLRLSNFENTSALIGDIRVVVPESVQEGYEEFIARFRPPKPRVKYGDKVMIRLALAAFVAAIAASTFRGKSWQPLAVLQLSMPIVAVAIIALVDLFRKPSRTAAVAAIFACVAAINVAAMLRPLFAR